MLGMHDETLLISLLSLVLLGRIAFMLFSSATSAQAVKRHLESK